MTKFNYNTRVYTTSGRVPVAENCNCITFTNTGDTTVTIDDMVLYPGTPGSILGDSRSIGGNEGEILAKKDVVVSFSVPAGALPAVEITQKYYVK